MPLITQAAKALEMVARFGSIRSAAERINAAPSAVNRQILNLEAEFGTPLFERLPRGMRLTEAGQMLVEQIRLWQRDNERALASVEVLRNSGGYVKVGVMECLAAEFLPQVLAELRQDHPGAALRAIVGGTGDVAAQLIASEIDLAVTFNLPRDAGLKIMHEVRMDLGAVMRPDHPLATRSEIHLEDLLEYPLVLADNTLTIGPMVDAMIERSRKPPRRTVSTNSVTMLKALVRQGTGISMLTLLDVYSEVRAGDLHFAPVAGARMFEILSVSARDEKRLTPTAQRMAELMCSALDEMRRS